MQALNRVKEVSNLGRGSKAWCRAKSSFTAAAAASVPCDEQPVVNTTRKHVSLAERRAMVEAFVNRYRGENSGKFPTVTHARKEVGGAFYTVKSIMQELESNAGKEVLPVVETRRKHVSLAERRAMVEAFVNRYRGENSGKFPTVTHAKKEVGGGFYTVNSIMQELEYISKLSSSNAGKEVLPETEVRSSYISSGSESDADEYKPSPESPIRMDTKDVNEEEHYQFPQDIDSANSKSEFLQPLSEVSCSENPKEVAEQLTHGSVIEVDGLESKIDSYQPSLEYLLPKKAENNQEEETNQCLQQPLPEVSSAKKSEDAREETLCESVLDVDDSECKTEEHHPSPEYPFLKLLENSKEEKSNQEFLPDIDGSDSISEFRQPLSEVSCSENPKDVAEKLICGSVLEVDGSESKTNYDQPSQEYLPPKKAENIPEDEPNQYIQQPLPEVSSAKKSENAKEETRCESVIDVNNSQSKNEEHQPSHEYLVSKISENTKEVKPNQVVVDMDGSESIAEEHRKPTGESSEKQALEKVEVKSSIWGTLKSAAEGFFSIWRKH